MNEGFDVCLEMSGHPSDLGDIFTHSSHGAKVSLLGIFPESFQVDWDKVIFKGLVLKGIYGRELFETWYKMSSMIRAGLDTSPIITHRFPVADFVEAFEMMRSGRLQTPPRHSEHFSPPHSCQIASIPSSPPALPYLQKPQSQIILQPLDLPSFLRLDQRN